MTKSERMRLLGLRNRKHGQAIPGARGPTYRSWECMKSRCLNQNDPSFKDYGARGIRVTDRWANDFEAFLSDMGERPRGTSLDRIDVNLGYQPGNCRWADAKVQGRNRRSNRLVEWDGQTVTIAELSERTGTPYQRLHERIVRRGWDVLRAVTETPRGFR